MSDFVVHALTVGGGILALCPLPGRGGAYAADLAHLKEWKPSMLISLVTEVEFLAEGATTLGADISDAGSRWAHLPITDYGVPDEAFIEQWPEVRDAALAALRGGGRVLVHCMGGCGRSGMVMLRLMIEAGKPLIRRWRGCGRHGPARSRQRRRCIGPKPGGCCAVVKP